MLSWAVPKGPSFSPVERRLAIHVEDHPIEYRNFEGTIPQGQYGGGTVMIWDEGFYTFTNDFKKGILDGSLKFELFGKRLQGKWALIKTIKYGKTQNKHSQWLLIKEKDKFAREETGIAQFTTSIRTGRTMQEIAERKR